jgi:alpha-1,2-mannosyltransferase
MTIPLIPRLHPHLLRRPAPGRLLLLAGLGWLVLVAATGASAAPDRHFVDLDIYVRSVRGLLDGGPLYCEVGDCPRFGFTYPPVAAAWVAPLTVVPAVVARAVWTATTLLVVLCVVPQVLRRLPGGAGRHAEAATGVVLLSEPLRETVLQGQTSVVVSCLVLAGLVGGRARHGALLGLAAAVKVTPALAVVALVVAGGGPGGPARRRRDTALLGGLAATSVGVLLAPADTVTYFARTLWQTDRVGPLDAGSNNSVAGVAAHLHLGAVTGRLLVGSVTAAAVAVLVVVARRTRWEAAEARARLALLAGTVVCLVTPLTWTHHCVVPVVAALWVLLARSRALGALLLLPWLLPVMRWAAEQHGTPLGDALLLPRCASLVGLVAVLGLSFVPRTLVSGTLGDDPVLVDLAVDRRPGHPQRRRRGDLVAVVVDEAGHDGVPLEGLDRREHPARDGADPGRQVLRLDDARAVLLDDLAEHLDQLGDVPRPARPAEQLHRGR